jgi:hypothetical protein
VDTFTIGSCTVQKTVRTTKINTWNLGWRVESGGNFRVHIDEQVVLASVLFMSSFDMTIDPVFEELAKSCIDDIGQPLTRQQMEFFLVR